jgi:exopolyphosphatase/guanosine-5'-triphosphate,3'-diphosphate pyrophosphatase
MESQIQRIVDQVRGHVPEGEPLTMLTLGGDMRFAAGQLKPDWNAHSTVNLRVEDLRKFTDLILALSVDETVHTYHLAFSDAEAVGPALLTYTLLAEALQLKKVLVSSLNLRDGLIKDMASHQAWNEEFADQIIRSAVDFGRRFAFDEVHGRHVAELCRVLFRTLQKEHQLDSRYEVILYIAGLLHDVGYAVSSRSHHKHSMYLINNGDLFGLSKKDVTLAALTARYHRRSAPNPSHEGYATLDWENRVNLVKMAAMLRVADALDRSNDQRIKNIICSREGARFVISVPGADDLSVEQLALRQKSALFKEVFGLSVLLRNAPDVMIDGVAR